MDTNANVIAGNFIGLRADGTTVAANGSDGVFIQTSFNRIGGATPVERNVISGNLRDGIFIQAGPSIPFGNLVQGNFIGTDATGTADRGERSARFSMARVCVGHCR